MATHQFSANHLLCGNEAHVNSPSNTCQGTNKVASLNSFDSSKVDDAHGRPELPTGIDEGSKVGLGSLPDYGPVDSTKVNGTRRSPISNGLGKASDDRNILDSKSEGVDVSAKEKRVRSGTNSLVQGELDESVAD